MQVKEPDPSGPAHPADLMLASLSDFDRNLHIIRKSRVKVEAPVGIYALNAGRSKMIKSGD